MLLSISIISIVEAIVILCLVIKNSKLKKMLKTQNEFINQIYNTNKTPNFYY